MSDRVEIVSPVGRIVQGSVYKPNDKDSDGNPLVFKNGPNKGQPRVQYYIAVAIPKNGETHWNQTEWGAKIWQVASQSFPNLFPNGQSLRQDFSFKVEDGDSAVPNTKGVANNTREGFAGNWIVKLSNGFAPKLVNKDGTQTITEVDAIKAGYFVQVLMSVSGNQSTQSPGVYLNLEIVSLQAYGEEIRQGVDAASVGFGSNVALPAGATAAPTTQNFAPAPAPQVTAPPTAPAPAPQVTAPPTAPAPAPQVVTPPPVPAPPAHDIVDAAAGRPTLTPAAQSQGYTYEMLSQGGWSDDQMRQAGYLV